VFTSNPSVQAQYCSA